MKKILLAFLLVSTFCAAQDNPVHLWSKTFGAFGNDAAAAMTRDAEGNIYTAGVFNATVDFDPGPGEFLLTQTGNSPDGFVQKLDPQGNFIWAKRMGGADGNHFSAIAIAPNGDIIVGGIYNGTVDFNPNAGTFNLSSTPMLNPVFKSYDIVVVALKASGDFLWARSFGGTQSDSLTAMTIDADGNIVLTGFYGETADLNPTPGVSENYTATGGWDGFVVKMGGDGSFIWARSLGSGNDVRINGLTTDAQSNLLLTGHYVGTLDADPGSGVHELSPGATDQFNQSFFQSFALKWNADGNLVWAGKIGADRGILTDCATTDTEGNLYLGGTFWLDADFDPGEGTHILSTGTNSMGLPNTNFYLLKLHADGSFGWARNFPSSYGDIRKLLFTDGNLLAGGNFEQQFPLGGTNDITLVSEGDRDMFLARFSAQGETLWGESFGGAGDDELADMLFDQTAGVWYSCGSFDTSADLDPGEGVHLVTANGWADAFVTAIGPEELSVSPASVSDAWRLYPNPSNGTVFLSFDGNLSEINVAVFNLIGQKITDKTVSTSQTELILPSGTYLVEITTAQGKSVRKLIVN